MPAIINHVYHNRVVNLRLSPSRGTYYEVIETNKVYNMLMNIDGHQYVAGVTCSFILGCSHVYSCFRFRSHMHKNIHEQFLPYVSFRQTDQSKSGTLARDLSLVF